MQCRSESAVYRLLTVLLHVREIKVIVETLSQDVHEHSVSASLLSKVSRVGVSSLSTNYRRVDIRTSPSYFFYILVSLARVNLKMFL